MATSTSSSDNSALNEGLQSLLIDDDGDKISDSIFGPSNDTTEVIVDTEEQLDNSPDQDESPGRTIKIFVGEGTEPLLVSEARLRLIDYFEAALKNDRWPEARSGIFKFPVDDLESWKVMASYIEEADEAGFEEFDVDLLIRCWMLGDQYGVKFFQDNIMYTLVCVEQDEVVRPKDLAAYFEAAPPSSHLRLNLADYAVYLAEVKGAVKWKNLRMVFKKNDDFATEVLSVRAHYLTDSYPLKNMVFGKNNAWIPDPIWVRYMVDFGPREPDGWFRDPVWMFWREGEIDDWRKKGREKLLAKKWMVARRSGIKMGKDGDYGIKEEDLDLIEVDEHSFLDVKGLNALGRCSQPGPG